MSPLGGKSVLLSEVMPMLEQKLKEAVECERRMFMLDFKRMLGSTDQDLFTMVQIERLLEQVMIDRGCKD